MNVAENPSGTLAQSLDPDATILRVAYGDIDRWLDSKALDCATGLLMCGVHPSARTLRLELVAHNEVTGIADVDGQTPLGSIQEGLSPRLASTLVSPSLADKVAGGRIRNLRLSTDGGRYLCNYALFQALARRPELPAAFLHIPPFSVVPLARQVELARWIITECHRARYL